MLARITHDVIRISPDYVIILGDSNDLGWGLNPQAVKENLVAMYTMALSKDIKPVAVTVPSIRGFDELIGPRQELNHLIQKEAAQLDIPCVDMFTASAESHTLRLAEKYSNDGLHLTTQGYKLLADILYDNVFHSLDSSL
jgi:acyl-CoA thioesterase-1